MFGHSRFYVTETTARVIYKKVRQKQLKKKK